MTKIEKVYYSSVTILGSDLMFLEHFGHVGYEEMLRGSRSLVRTVCYNEAFKHLLKL